MSSHSSKKSRYKARKKQRNINTLKRYTYNVFTFTMYLGLLIFTYLLFYSLLFEPILISKSYGPNDIREMVYLAIAGFIVGLSYFIKTLINYKEEQQWQKNWRLLRDVKFDLTRYSSLRRMGIDHINKRKQKKKHHHSSKEKHN